MNRIEKRMEELQNKNEKAFVTYMTAGLPDMEGTKALIKAQAEAGIDIIELEFHFLIQPQTVRLSRMHPIVPSVKEQT